MTWCRRFVAAAKMGAEVIPGLLESIRKATSERREYGKGKKAQNLRQLRRKLRTKDLVYMRMEGKLK